MRRIVVDPKQLAGEPHFEGTQISVGLIVEMVRAGMSPEAVVEVYPELTVEDVQAALEFESNA